MIKRFLYRYYELVIFILYFASHLYELTSLPVFADESIYIRWSQLIISDWSQYIFFPLNDGKTPLLMWLLVPFLWLINNPLLAARLMSVIIGFLQMVTIKKIVVALGGNKIAVLTSLFITGFAPFWFVHHRLAVIDALLTLSLSLSLYFLIKLLIGQKSVGKSVKYVLLSGLFLGLAFYAKLPAVLFIPCLLLLTFLEGKTFQRFFYQFLEICSSIVVGLVLFLTLRISPSFGQLFSRGGDFLYPANEVLWNGLWQNTIINWPNYFNYFFAYLSLPIMLLFFSSIFYRKHQRTYGLMILCWFSFFIPIALLGKVVYPRYFLPSLIFVTINIALLNEEIVQLILRYKRISIKSVISVFYALILAQIISFYFIFTMIFITSPDQTPFVSADRQQYLEEWSSGHGITEAVSIIKEKSLNGRVVVATEGYFGTLPDAINMYLFNEDVNNIYVEGIGYPVDKIPVEFLHKIGDYQSGLLVVNSHRMKLNSDEIYLIDEFCRPNGAPCLQVYDITQLLNTLVLPQ